MHLNPQTIPRTVRGKTVFHESGPWCQKVGDCYSRETAEKSHWTSKTIAPNLKTRLTLFKRHPHIRPSFSPIPAGPTLWVWHTARASGFSVSVVERLSGSRGNSSHWVQFPSRLSVVSPETPGRASSKACAVTRVPGKTKGFDSQQSYMLFFFFFFQFWCWKEQGERERLQNCLPV